MQKAQLWEHWPLIFTHTEHSHMHTHGHNLANHFPTCPTKKSSPHIKTSLKPQFYASSPTETKQPFSQCAHVHKHPSVESCDVAGGYFQPTSKLGKTAPRSNGLVKPEQVYSMETGSQTWGTEENLFDIGGKEEGEGNQCLWTTVNGAYERSGQLFYRHREVGESDPEECARAMGALSLSLFSSVAIPDPFLFPCPYAVHAMQMSLGNWAVGLSARQRAKQEQEQLPDRREEPELFLLGSSPHREVWGRRRLKTATHRTASQKTAWTRTSSRAACALRPGEGYVQSWAVFKHSHFESVHWLALWGYVCRRQIGLYLPILKLQGQISISFVSVWVRLR